MSIATIPYKTNKQQFQTTKGWQKPIQLSKTRSGKTLSFTTLTALARDNDYQIVIVLAGSFQHTPGDQRNFYRLM